MDHRDHVHIERAWVRSDTGTALQHDGFYYIFMVFIKMLFAIHLKHSRLWPSAEVKPLLNDAFHAMPRQCMFAISMCMHVMISVA